MTFRDPVEPGNPTWTKPGWAYTNKRWEEWIVDTSTRAAIHDHRAVKWVRCREFHRDRGVTHFHALISGTKDQRRDAAWARWFERNGIARIEPYDPAKGAGFYLCKYVTKTQGEITFSWNIERRSTEQRSTPLVGG